MKNKKLYLILLSIIVAGFLFRAYPHLFLVTRWMPEEEAQWTVVKELVETGSALNIGWFQPVLMHYFVYLLTIILPISPITISQFFAPIIGSLSIIPLYLFSRRYLTEKKSLLVCVLFTFSEALFHRSAKFTPEALAIFFMLWTLYFYEKAGDKKGYFLGVAVLLLATFYTHLIPLIVGITIIFVDALIFGSRKKRVMIFSVVIAFVALMFSPISPAGKAKDYLNPIYLVSKVNLANIFNLYSLSEIVQWMPVFLGSFSLIVVFSFILIKKHRFRLLKMLKKQPKIFASIFIAVTGIFLFTWIGYNAAMMSPVRMLSYPIIAMIFVVINELNSKQIVVVSILAVLMVSSSWSLGQEIFWLSDCVTENEYKAMDDLIELGIFIPEESVTEWFVDMPARYMMLPHLNRKWIPNVNPDFIENDIDNETVVIQQNRETQNFSVFNHVYISERMEAGGLFRVSNSSLSFSARKFLMNIPIVDTLASDPEWILIYDDYDVKVYEPTGGYK